MNTAEPIPLTCPNCDRDFRVKPAAAGRSVRCPKCKQPVPVPSAEITGSEDPDPLAEPSHPAPDASGPPAIPNVRTDARPVRSGGAGGRRNWAIVGGLSAACFVLGYFAGREHVKYQIRSAFASAGEALAEGFQAPNHQGTASVDDQGTPAESSTAEAPPEETIALGETHDADGFSLSLAKAELAKPKATDLMGETVIAKKPELLLTFSVTNTDDRKILRFRKGNMFLAGPFQLRDDVGNTIRGIDYGATHDVVGALTGNEDIAPGESATHLEVFSVPPPKTEHLICAVDLEAFGGDGTVGFKIPADQIQGWGS